MTAGTVLVTGAGGRLGVAVAEAIAARGVALVVSDVRPAPLEGLAARLGGSVPVEAIPADCRDASAVGRLVDRALGLTGALAACVNVAGSEGPVGSTEDLDMDAVRALYEVNVFAVLNVLAAAVPRMRRQGSGRIVNVASGSGLSGSAYMAAYSSSKHAVLGLTRSLAKELAPVGVSVNAICPGCIESPMMGRIESGLSRVGGGDGSFVSSIPAGRYAQADEVANVIAYLALEAPPYLTGAAVLVDGALYA